jgi:hypothetical protein
LLSASYSGKRTAAAGVGGDGGRQPLPRVSMVMAAETYVSRSAQDPRGA